MYFFEPLVLQIPWTKELDQKPAILFQFFFSWSPKQVIPSSKNENDFSYNRIVKKIFSEASP